MVVRTLRPQPYGEFLMSIGDCPGVASTGVDGSAGRGAMGTAQPYTEMPRTASAAAVAVVPLRCLFMMRLLGWRQDVRSADRPAATMIKSCRHAIVMSSWCGRLECRQRDVECST